MCWPNCYQQLNWHSGWCDWGNNIDTSIFTKHIDWEHCTKWRWKISICQSVSSNTMLSCAVTIPSFALKNVKLKCAWTMKVLALHCSCTRVLWDLSPVSNTVNLLAPLIKHIVELLPIVSIFGVGEFLNRFSNCSSLVLVQYIFDLNPGPMWNRCGPAELITHHHQGICKHLNTKGL